MFFLGLIIGLVLGAAAMYAYAWLLINRGP